MKREKRIYQIVLVTFVITLCFITNVCAETEYGVSLVLESPESDDSFGSSVALNGDYVYIGAKDSNVGEIMKAGKVYIYLKGKLVATLESPNPGQDMKFGTKIHVIDETLLVSEVHFGYDSRGYGVLHIFDLDGTYKNTLNQPVGDDSTFFGTYVSKSGEELVIAEPNSNTEHGKWTGQVHVYDMDWNLVETYFSPEPIIEGNFGARLVANKDTIVVSELIGNFDYGDHKKGKVHIFDSDWNILATLSTPENMLRDNFGYALGTNDEYVFIGDRTADVDGLTRAGKIYVYDREGVCQYNITAPVPEASSYFAKNFVIQNEMLMVGQPDYDSDGAIDSGKAYVFKTDGEFIAELISPEPSNKGLFGDSISINGNRLLVSETGSGKVYMYSLGVPPLVEFKYSNLNVSPVEVIKDKTATITVDCTNIGTVSGSTDICMMIDGERIENKTVTVDAGQTKTVTYTYSTDEVGIHKVEIQSLASEYKVTDGIPGFPVSAITSGLLVTAYLVYHLSRKR